MSIDIIKATEKDRCFFRVAHHVAYREIIESMFNWNEQEQDKYADNDFDERNPHIILYDKIPAGVIGWQDKPDYIWFGPIFILPKYQNQGIGSYLVRKFIDKANSQNLTLRLQTLLRNERAKKLYDKLGFKTVSSDDIHWQMEYKR
ncbi:MAG: GNAT family N-acetyltransferase [Rickettsiales bacterium]